MADNTNGTTIKVDTHDLELTIDSLKNAVTGAIKGINTSANDKQSSFEAALQKVVAHSIEFSSKKLREFHQSSLTTMNGEVLKYEKIINGTLTKIEQSKLVTQTEKHGIDFEERDKKVRDSQNQLITEQKQAFTDFTSALKQVANRLLTVSGMFDKANELQGLKNHADFIGSPFNPLSTFITLGKTVKGADETYLKDAYDKMFELFQQRHTKDFDKNELIKLLSQQKGQERLAGMLKAADDPMAFIELLMKAMSQGKDNSNISEHIKKDITKDDATYIALTDKNVLKHLPWAEQNTKTATSGLDAVLNVGVKNRKRQADHEATQAASVDQSALILNTINQLLSRVMEQFPDTSKTVLSIAALGSALDDTTKTVLQLGGGLLLFKGAMNGFKFMPEAVGGGGLAARLGRLAINPYTLAAAASYGSGTLAGYLTDDTPEEKQKKAAAERQHSYNEIAANAPYIPTVDQNMNGYHLAFDSKARQYKYFNPETGKEALMGRKLPEIKHAYDEWVANAQKRQEFQDQTGTKLMMKPRGHGLLSNSGTIEYIAVDADGKEVANFGRKLNMSKRDMVNQLSTHYNRYQIPASRLPNIDANAVRSSPIFSKSSIKDQSFNQGLSMDMSKIKEQMSTSMQLSRQLLNTPSTMQQRFNFYFTLPQNNSGRIEHSFENNSVVSRKAGGSTSNVSKYFTNAGARGTY